MKESYKGLCNLNADELKGLLADDKTSIVLDTEILLMLFKMKEKNSDELLTIMEDPWLSEKLWMPHDVGYSFMCNVNTFIINERRQIKDARKILEDFHDKVVCMKSNPYLQDDVLANFKSTFEEITKSFVVDIKALDEELEKNLKRERIDKIFTKTKIGDDYTDAQLRELYKRGSERYSQKMPPGMDNGNSVERERYKDYIIWKEMQSFASYHKRNIVMVRGCKTTDWFNLDDNNGILGPNPAIVSEFYAKTSETSGFDATFYCLDVVSFLEKCHKYEFIDAPSEELLSQLKEMVVVSNNDKNAITSPNNMVSSNSSNTMSTGEVNK